MDTIKQGDFFYTSWGYDQTNIDYLIVTKVSPSGKTVKCKMVHPIYVGTSGVEDVLMPGDTYGNEFIMQVRGEALRGSYPYCNGDRRLDTFFRTKLAETRNQTMPQFGH